MDFQTHLYRPGEMEQLLRKAGFEEISVYSSFQKDTERYNDTPFLLYANNTTNNEIKFTKNLVCFVN